MSHIIPMACGAYQQRQLRAATVNHNSVVKVWPPVREVVGRLS